MYKFTQGLLDGIDKTTEEGFAEALLVCIGSLRNEEGLLVRVRLGNAFGEDIAYAKQIARMMLNKE